MSGPAHRATTAALAVALAAAAHAAPEQAGAFVAVAAATAGGPLSPDCDLRLPLVSHRGLTHWLPFVALVAYAVYLGAAAAVPKDATAIGLGVLAGWGLHVLEDSLTPDGVPLWPLTGRWHLLPTVGRLRVRVVSGTPREGHRYVAVNEWIVAAPLLAASLLLLPGVLT